MRKKIDMQQLTIVQTEFLKILEAFMHDRVYILPEDFMDLDLLYKMAAEHHMIAAVYEKIRNSVSVLSQEMGGFMNMWKRSTIRDVMMQVQKAEGFLSVYDKLRKAGVKPLVMKGIICRHMYANPDARISADEDILLPREDFVLCDRILLEEGFTRENKVFDPNDLPHEIPYLNRRNGTYIELHLSLFPEENSAYGHLNEEFEHVFENAICEKPQGRDVWTLGPTDHMFYLICHSFKHFLHGGFGLRQVCDMVLMAEQYGSKIDWTVIREKLERLNMAMYWDSLVKIGQDYLGFSLEKAGYGTWREEDVDYGPMLMDLLDSGIYGSSTVERQHSANMTLAAAVNGRKDTTGSLLASLFPTASYMKKQFTWLETYPWLLPVAYIIRIFRYMKKSGVWEKEEQSSIRIGTGRVELLRKYGIIK